jgi:hypothetical protein
MILNTTYSKVRSVPIDGRTDVLFVVENEPLERLLFDRNLVGVPFREACREASREYVRHLADEIPADGELAELVVLSKGLMYQLADAVAAELDANLPMNLVATRRASVGENAAAIETMYARFDAGGDTLLLGDTIASGATVCAAVDAYRQVHNLRALYVLSFAGSLVGARRIVKHCSANGIAVSLLYGLAAFGLARNGFDLSFLHPDTICADRYRKRARALFGGRAVSAVGWDFGSQAMAPGKYANLCWLEADYWGLQGHPSLACAQRPVDLRVVAAEAAASLVPPEGQ